MLPAVAEDAENIRGRRVRPAGGIEQGHVENRGEAGRDRQQSRPAGFFGALLDRAYQQRVSGELHIRPLQGQQFTQPAPGLERAAMIH